MPHGRHKKTLGFRFQYDSHGNWGTSSPCCGVVLAARAVFVECCVAALPLKSLGSSGLGCPNRVSEDIDAMVVLIVTVLIVH